MTDEELMAALQALAQMDYNSAPKMAYLVTPDCPTAPRWREVMGQKDGTWTKEERDHINCCKTCSRILKLN